MTRLTKEREVEIRTKFTQAPFNMNGPVSDRVTWSPSSVVNELLAEIDALRAEQVNYSSCDYTAKEMHKIHGDYQQFLRRETMLRYDLAIAVEALEVFQKRRKLGYQMGTYSPHVSAFIESIGIEIDKVLAEMEKENR